MRFSLFLRLVGILVLGAVLLPAQIGTSTITGSVTDPTGAIIPEVVVTVTNVETNFTFTGRTNTDGLYRVPSLQPGPYRITFQAAGFKQFVRDGVMLRSGDVLPVNAVMELGLVTESIGVTTAAPLIETQTSSAGSVVEGHTLTSLPMYQRFVDATSMFMPGVSVGTTSGSGTVSGYNMAGQRSSAIGTFEDGISLNDPTSDASTIRSVQNSVAEVTVLTTALPAEYGHSAGGVVSIVKKTGTNELHGMGTFYGHVRQMQQRNFFDQSSFSQPVIGFPNGITPFFFINPEANIGGPVVLPKVYNGRNKTFFFFGWNKIVEKIRNFQAFGTVPDQNMKNGNFSFGGLGVPIYDPSSTRQLPDGTWARDVFPNSQIPLSRFNPVAQKILQINPWDNPNTAGTYNSAGPSGNFAYSPPSRTYFDDVNGRMDHQFNPSVKIYGSFTWNKSNGAGRPANIQVRDFDGTNGPEGPSINQSWSTGGSWIISPTLFNDARFGYFRKHAWVVVPSEGQDYGKILGIPNISPELLPAFGTGDQMTPGSIYGLTVSGPSHTIQETFTLRDDLTKIVGTHVFKFGYEWMRFRMNAIASAQPSGAFSFAGMTAGLQPNGVAAPRTGNTFAGFLLGQVAQATFTTQLASWLPRSTISSFYVQDEWKASRNVTVSYGVRYSNESPFTTKYGQMSQFSPTAIDPVSGMPGAVVHPTSALWKRDNNNFQPRLGVAWHPLEKLAVRSGFGLYTVDVKFPTTLGNFQEYTAQANYQQPPGNPMPIYAINAIPSPVTYTTRANGTSGFLGTNYSTRTQDWWDPNLRNPYTLNWDLSVQYQLSKTYVLELLYQGSAGVGLIEDWNVNTFPVDYGANNPALRAAAFAAPQNYVPFPNFGAINFRSNFGHSTYHGGTVRLERRFASGLIFQTFFTLAKAIDSQDSDNSGSGVAPIQNRGLEKARAGFDRPIRYFNSITYELPVGKGRHFLNRGGWMDVIIGGWQTAWDIDWESGAPLTFSFANSPYNYYPTSIAAQRPNCTGNPALLSNWLDMGPARFNQLTINPVIDINQFSYPAAFTPGTCGRDNVGGPPKFAIDSSAQKILKLNDRFNFTVRLDIHSVQKMLFNRYNFTAPTTVVDFLNPTTFAKLSAGPSTSLWGGTPIINLDFILRF
jgi:hypothetical protein